MGQVDQLLRESLDSAWLQFDQGNTDAAMPHAKQASTIAPDSAEVAHLLGLLAYRDGRYDLALPLLQKALDIEVTEKRLRDIAQALLAAGHPSAALTPLQDAIQRYGISSANQGLLAAIHIALGQFQAGEQAANAAIALSRNPAAWLGSLAFCELIQQKWRIGFEHQTGRSENHLSGSRSPALRPGVSGELWLKNEQGPGDTLFYLRHASALSLQGWKLHIQCDKKTKPLLRQLAEFASVKDELAIPHNGFWLKMGDLPLAAIQLGADEVQAPLMLKADPKRIARIRAQLAALGPAPYVAVTWRAGPRGSKIRAGQRMFDKHIAPQTLGAQLASVKATFISVQRVPDASEFEGLRTALGGQLADLSSFNDKLEDMLALLSLVDEYVAVPNTNVHLRAGLGLSAQILINYPVQDWRWLAQGDSSPWYPNMRIHRQSADLSWAAALSSLSNALPRPGQPRAVQPRPEVTETAAVLAESSHAQSDFSSDRSASDLKASDLNASDLKASDLNASELRAAELTASEIRAGWQAIAQHKISEAIQTAQRILQQQPDHPAALHLLGWAAMRDMKPDIASKVLARAASLAPQDGRIVADLLRALIATEQFEQAEQMAAQALAQPALQHAANVYRSRAGLFQQLNRLPEAIHDFEHSLRLAPGQLSTQEYCGMARLKLGDARLGFRDLSARKSPQRQDMLNDWCSPRLQAGQTARLLIKRDMGLGDELTYLRYLPWLTAAGYKVDYWSGKKLAPMLKRHAYLHEVFADDESCPPREDYDLSFIVNDLPLAVEQLEAPAIAPPLPLQAQAALLEKWQHWLQQQGPGPYIGVTWRAGLNASDVSLLHGKLSKHIPVEALAAALQPVQATWVALQRNCTITELRQFEQHLGARLCDAAALTDDLEELLALLTLLDEHVGVSSTNMHLRAGTGRPSRVLVQFPGDWRWGHEGASSPWFPNDKVYREAGKHQVAANTCTWSSALAALQSELQQAWPAGAAHRASSFASNLASRLPGSTAQAGSIKNKRIIWITAGAITQLEGVMRSALSSTQQRVIAPLTALQQRGWSSEVVNEELSQAMGGWGSSTPMAGDVVVVSKVFGEHALKLAQDAKQRGAWLVTDFCNDFLQHPQRGPLQKQLAILADLVTVASPALQASFSAVTSSPVCITADLPAEPGKLVSNQLLEQWEQALLQVQQAPTTQRPHSSQTGASSSASTSSAAITAPALKLQFKHADQPRVLVGILYSGEHEYAACLAMLAAQTFENHQHFVIEHLPNKLAHDTLYASFMQHAAECDYFLKLDADMLFDTQHSFAEMLEFCQKHTLAHLFAWVYDCPSQINIPGIQMFASSTRWLGSDEQLNVDYPPKLAGKSAVVTDQHWIDHMPDPDDYQYFRYGVHKALKSLQPDRDNKNIKKGILHLSILQGIARHARASDKQALWLALIGASFVYRKHLIVDSYHSDQTRALFAEIMESAATFEACKAKAAKFWHNDIETSYWWLENFSQFRY
ncbi:tetratricopeptide repeat protein [Pseudomethylobacillus aquaticus]|nr:tetratricopeptide repeat protein [Pseudomethylobacillus aquaticus]